MGKLTAARHRTLYMISRSPTGKPIHDLDGRDTKSAEWLLSNHLIMTAFMRNTRYVLTDAGRQALIGGWTVSNTYTLRRLGVDNPQL